MREDNVIQACLHEGVENAEACITRDDQDVLFPLKAKATHIKIVIIVEVSSQCAKVCAGLLSNVKASSEDETCKYMHSEHVGTAEKHTQSEVECC